MDISGNKKVVKEFKKFTGVGEFSVLGFNLSREEIIQNCGYDPGVDQEYVKEKEGIKGNNLNVFLKERNTGNTMRVSFNLWDKPMISSAGNPRYVNVKCANNYANPLPDWFTQHEHRQAFDGEAEFLVFMKAWLSNFDWFDNSENGAKFPLKEVPVIISGNVNGLNGLAKKHKDQTVGVLCGIRTTESGDKQDTSNRTFLPGYLVSKIQTIPKNLSEKDRDSQVYSIREFLKIIEGQYGYKNFYKSYAFEEYDPRTNVISATDNAVIDDNNIRY